MKIAYFVHDVNDSAVERRVRMMHAAGGDPIVLGFRRGDSVTHAVDGAPVIDLGRTRDAQLAQRAAAVVGNLGRPRRMLDATAGADVVIGRNLEALALAARVKRALPRAGLVYECLDIHRTLLGTSLPARLIQAAEARLLRRVDLLLSSSPAFISDYFDHRPTLQAPRLLVENKVLALEGAPPSPAPVAAQPPWVIGWFGMLRCKKTFARLAELVNRANGFVRVLIAGRASPAEFPDFESQVAGVEGFTYRGPYKPADLPALYASCHFAWAIDYFEEGLNSRWLLPNRLYEATTFGAVPIALRSVETGRWLDRHDAGLVVDDDLDALANVLAGLDPRRYAALRDHVAAIPRRDLIADRRDCEHLMTALTRTRH
ncbi:hypothetical protein [Hephaestia mangrovi]|uniref:hypothetical protein n=1 Tax=Hephaestia mangrovi TaxID=2873268 RepID=UPI001CA6B2A6|nr:hypothetical protein [Hephaestia mangrovi]MBY8829749.1 hypothetical protein [Hephaestia mangrovi]